MRLEVKNFRIKHCEYVVHPQIDIMIYIKANVLVIFFLWDEQWLFLKVIFIIFVNNSKKKMGGQNELMATNRFFK